MEEKDIFTLDKEILLLKYIRKQTSAEENLLVESWLDGSDDFQKESELVRHFLAMKSQKEKHDLFDTHTAFTKVIWKIKQRNRRRKIFNNLSRAAAIISIPLLISTLTFGYMLLGHKTSEIENTPQYMEVLSATGMITRIELPDHSIVCLNAGSSLRYPAVFSGNSREVELTGEAFFEVRSDKEHPFIVTSGSGLKVTAVGTKFSVNTYNDQEDLEVILVEGLVNAYSNGELITNLKPGEKLSYNIKTEQYEVNEVNTYEKTAWKDGKIVFRDTPLEEVLRVLSRHFNVEITFHNPDKSKSKEYNCWATFTNETLYQILGYLEHIAPIKWKVKEIKQNDDATFDKQRIEVLLK